MSPSSYGFCYGLIQQSKKFIQVYLTTRCLAPGLVIYRQCQKSGLICLGKSTLFLQCVLDTLANDLPAVHAGFLSKKIQIFRWNECFECVRLWRPYVLEIVRGLGSPSRPFFACRSDTNFQQVKVNNKIPTIDFGPTRWEDFRYF